MKTHRHNIMTLKFKGEPFDDHSLNADALGEILRIFAIIPKTAEALWRAQHLDRERLPKGFGTTVRLCFGKIDEGSTSIPVEAVASVPAGEHTDWNNTDIQWTKDAAVIAYEAIEAAVEDKPIPNGVPKALLPDYAEIGRKLAGSGVLEIAVPDRKPVSFTSTARERLEKFIEPPSTALTEISGTVLAADIKQGKFKLWLEDGSPLEVPFTPEQEQTVLQALVGHGEVKLSVKGEVMMSGDGTVMRVVTPKMISITGAGQEFDETAPSIEDVIAGIVNDVPGSEWGKLPADLSSNLDHYVYGSPKNRKRKRK